MRPAGVVAIVPARGGSKSIPRKNLRDFAGYPLLVWSIEAALQARSVDLVLVTTDDPEIRETAMAFGAEAPFLRPAELAMDDTPDLPVFQHALEWLQGEGASAPEILVHVRPTSPLRPPGLLDEAVSLLAQDAAAHSLRAVTEPGQNPFKMWRPCEEGRRMRPLIEDGSHEPFNQPRQRLPATLWQTGHLDVVRRETLLALGSMTGSEVRPLRVDPRYAVDIDTLEQWAFAEWLVREASMPLVRPSGDPRRPS